MPRNTSPASEFFWRRWAAIRDWDTLDRLVAAIPSGYWTSYGALAEVLGTGARVVGTRLSTHGGPGAYRVLRADGSVSAGFHWSDGRETRTVREILESEGVEFTGSGRARPGHRLGAADLEDLLDIAAATENEEGE
ncbi:MAG TPA: MGMT family protein [Dietzia timorensis]|uniref:MGMT family protein n=1 Tax=Dietzia timorensis TaxID=499555 RepID=A0A921F4G9_9ACTN|nr:MGMT family protein [Dietzia timorensis]HJE90688.1 MGMT family protein [Dietzia timorensis]